MDSMVRIHWNFGGQQLGNTREHFYYTWDIPAEELQILHLSIAAFNYPNFAFFTADKYIKAEGQQNLKCCLIAAKHRSLHRKI